MPPSGLARRRRGRRRRRAPGGRAVGARRSTARPAWVPDPPHARPRRGRRPAGRGVRRRVLLVTGRPRPTRHSRACCCSRSRSSVVFAVLLAACSPPDLGRRCGPSRAPSTGCPPATTPGASSCPATTSSAGSRRATTASRATSAAATASCADPGRARGHHADERPDAMRRRAADQARDAFGMIDCAGAARGPARDPDRGARPRRAGAGARRPRASGRAARASSWATCPRRGAGSAPTRTCSSCSRSRSRRRSATPSCTRRSRPRTAAWSSLDEAKDDFLRGVSHNLQTPLASIRGYAQQLARTPDRRLGIITEQADRLSRMVRQLLTVTRIESGALRSRLEVVPPAAACAGRGRRWARRTCRSARRRLRGLARARRPRPARPGAVGAAGQRGRLRRADADRRSRRPWSRDGRPRGHHRRPWRGRRRGGPRPAVRAVRARRARPADEGSGLGLYVSRELCRAMGGDLVLEPAAAGRGAAFTVRLPAEAAEES